MLKHQNTLVATEHSSSRSCCEKDSRRTENGIRRGCEGCQFYKIKINEFRVPREELGNSHITPLDNGVQFPSGTEIFSVRHHVQITLGSHPSSYLKSTRGLFLRGWSSWAMNLTALLHLVPRLRMCGTIPPLTLTYSRRGAWLSAGYFMAWCLLKHRILHGAVLS